MGKKGIEKGELVLLGVFTLFVGLFLFDIRTLPLEGTFLSYLAAPFILLTILLCVGGVLKAARKEKAADGEGKEESGEEGKPAVWPFYMTIAAGFFLFLSIYLIGFYYGSGLMMLVWFVAFKKINRDTILLIISIPAGLYLAFEVFLDMGLPLGVLWRWLGL